jgi:hypothetical protein
MSGFRSGEELVELAEDEHGHLIGGAFALVVPPHGGAVFADSIPGEFER